MKIKGIESTREIFVDGKPLDPFESQKLRNHSPDGFMWGYGGSGPSQLALAICIILYGKEKALEKYQDFKWEYVAKWKGNFEVEI